jgi:hypothetical protein
VGAQVTVPSQPADQGDESTAAADEDTADEPCQDGVDLA